MLPRALPGWLIPALVISFGVLVGLAAFTFDYASGASYFSDDPRACINCHVMRPQFNSWNHGSHRQVAGCNDCHSPHTFPEKWLVKGINGWNHSIAFTTGNFPDNIHIRAFNSAVVEANCADCHAGAVSAIHRPSLDGTLSCVACHGNVGH